MISKKKLYKKDAYKKGDWYKVTKGWEKGMKVTLSEWLRSETWNLMGSPRAGSNPAGDVFL